MNMKQHLPSKKIRVLIILLVLTIAIFSIFIFIKRNTEDEKKLINVSLVSLNEQEDQRLLDSDNDGVYDWEEALWPELDPENPDSDGDGVSDKKYLEIKKRNQRPDSEAFTYESDLTETQKLARSTLTAILSIYQSGDDFNDETQAVFQENINEYISNISVGKKIYIRDELNLVPDTQENITLYRTEMQEIFSLYPLEAREIELIIKASEKPEEYRNRVRSSVSKYKDYVEALAILQVPYVLGGRHTELTNGISSLHGAMENLVSEEVDELVSLTTLLQMEKILNQTAGNIIYFNSFFRAIEDESVFSDQII